MTSAPHPTLLDEIMALSDEEFALLIAGLLLTAAPSPAPARATPSQDAETVQDGLFRLKTRWTRRTSYPILEGKFKEKP